MLEDKHDNLLKADGNTQNNVANAAGSPLEAPQPITAETATEIPFAEKVDETGESLDETTATVEAAETTVEKTEEIVGETQASTEAAEPETKAEAAATFEEAPEDVPAEANETHTVSTESGIGETEAEEAQEETDAVRGTTESAAEATAEQNKITQTEPLETQTPELETALSDDEHEFQQTPDYNSFSMETLVAELEKLSQTDHVMQVRDHVEQIKSAFLSQYNHFIEEKKEQFLAENPETAEEFHYHFPLKQRFDKLFNQYRDSKNKHLRDIQNNQQANLATRLAIVEELRELINPQENIKDTFKHFNELRDRWRNAGPIPKDKYNHVWNNYHFHVENFYDYLHLDREARDLDFKHNLEKKEAIIKRAEALLDETDISKAFRELQQLHKIWKEDIGPVSRERREDIWNRFSAITKQMHDKREGLMGEIRGREIENLEKKKSIIAQIQVLATEKQEGHASWQKQVEQVEALRKAFFATGKVPAEVNEQTWAAFKTAVRDFNSLKNSFYKDIKKEQQDNLNRKLALVAKANELKETEDFQATTPLMKQIQEEWKQIGHVPRKFSDKIWKDFKDACNLYFERLKASRAEANSEETEAFEKKKDYMETLKDFVFTGDHKADLAAIKAVIEHWKTLGRVPFSRKHIEGKFNKILDGFFEQLSLSKKDTDMMRFTNKIDQLSEAKDTRKLDNEKIFLMRKIEETQSEIFQLENNIQFFSSNSKKENPMVTEVRKSILRHKEELETLKEKLKQLRSLEA